MSQCLAEKVSKMLRDDIESGTYVPGQRLPSERALEDVYGVSRITINRAMSMLGAQGLLNRKRGVGSFVAKDFLMKTEDSLGDKLVKFLNPGAKVKGEVYVAAGQESMCKELQNYGKELIVKYYYSEADYIKELCGLRDSGIFGSVIWHLPSVEGDRILGKLKNEGVRFVLLDSYCPELEADYVITDNYHGSRMMTEYLISQGHKDIVYVTKMIDHFTSLENRQLGFMQGMVNNQLSITDKSIISVDLDNAESMDAAVENILSRKDRPTAVYASNDAIAFAIYDQLKARGVSVPEDISLVGFDDLDSSSRFEVPLTTISQDFYEICRIAVTLLEKQSLDKNRELCYHQKIKPHLVIRESVKEMC